MAINDGAYEAIITIKIKSSGLDQQAMEVMGNVKRFVDLCVLPCSFESLAIAREIVREDLPSLRKVEYVKPEDVPVMKA